MSSLSGFQFSAPILIKTTYEINRGFDVKGLCKTTDLPIAFKVSQGGKEENSEKVVLECTVGGKDENSPFYLVVAMQSRFRWSEDYTPEFIDKLLAQNAPALLLGYLRPFVAQITMASPFPPVHLPLIDFTKVS